MNADDRLTRAIGPWSLGANAVNLSVGAGIFALPAAVAGILGPAAILAYLVCGLAIALVLTCFAELGTRVTRSGGAVAYIEDSFGPMAGFVAWVVFTLGFCAAADAAVGAILIDAVSAVVPGVGQGAGRVAALVGVYGALAAVNIGGVRAGARLAVAATVGKLLPLLLIVGAGALAVNVANLRFERLAVNRPGRRGVARPVLRVRRRGVRGDARRRNPRPVTDGAARPARRHGVSHCAVLRGAAGVARACSGRPSIRAAGRRWRRWRSACSGRAAGAWCSRAPCSPRSACWPATCWRRRGPSSRWPKTACCRVRSRRCTPKYHTPHVAIITYAAISCALAVSGTFKPLAILASVSLLLIYLVVCLAALKMRASGPAPAGAFRAPGGPLVPVLGAATVGWLLAHTTRAEALGLAATVGLAALYFLVRRQALRGRSRAA